MAIPLYLAQTSAEFASTSPKPEHLAWMACHFSPYGTGITNIPKALPENALLILNDRTPICGHDPDIVAASIAQAAEHLKCRGILLDFQQDSEAAIIIAEKISALPYPVAVTEHYAEKLTSAVFLSMPPLHKPLSEHIAPWKNREIWLEIATGNERITITAQGSTFTAPSQQEMEYPFYDDALHCRYRVETENDQIRFYLHRGIDEISQLLDDAEKLGITLAVGLYQELWHP